MKLKPILLACVTLALSVGCSGSHSPSDGGEDAGVYDAGNGTCTSPCGPSQVCDPVQHICVDGCNNQCDGGTLCVKGSTGTFACTAPVTTCGTNSCQAGQTVCVSGGCSCLPSTVTSFDTCWDQGKICNAQYNPVAASGGACAAPTTYQECRTTGCTPGACAACAAGHNCVFGIFSRATGSIGTCEAACASNSDCRVDEMCDTGTKSCFPSSLFLNPDCAKPFTLSGAPYVPDGGPVPPLQFLQVPAANTCLLSTGRDSNGHNIYPDPTHPVGTCTFSIYDLGDRPVPINVCRPPGTVAENGSCTLDFSHATTATQCATGLECFPTQGSTGVCMRICNAVPAQNGIPSVPGCATGEACVNIYGFQARNSVVGVCAKACDVFVSGQTTCAAYGAFAASCVPADPSGQTLLSPQGSGVCMPQGSGAGTATLGGPCLSTASLGPAACPSPWVCFANGNQPQTCVAPCDLNCAGTTPPTGCATEPNAVCAAGKTCTSVMSTSGYAVGLCL